MKLILSQLLAILLMCTFAQNAWCSCDDNLMPEPYSGRAIVTPNEITPYVPKNSKVRLLSASRFNGGVYLISPKNGEQFVLKIYWSKLLLTEDLNRLEYLRKANHRLPKPRQVFNIVDAAQLSENVIRLNYVPGHTLGALLAEGSPVSPKLQGILWNNYFEGLKLYCRELAKQLTIISNCNSQSWMYVTNEGSYEQYYIHEDNVIVGTDLSMTIIDPF